MLKNMFLFDRGRRFDPLSPFHGTNSNVNIRWLGPINNVQIWAVRGWRPGRAWPMEYKRFVTILSKNIP